jgi:hypothetical protein
MEEIKNLIQLNEQIEAAENAGNLQQLREIVAPKLAFQRRDGSVVDQDGFLSTPKPGARVTQIESVHVYGNRAVVTCRVIDSGAVTHNIRLFVKVDGKWRLLGWANEPGLTGVDPATLNNATRGEKNLHWL